MNHVTLPILRWIRRAFIACSATLLATCLFVAFVLGYGYGSGGAYGVSFLVAGVCVLHLIYEGLSSLWFFDKNPGTATLASLSGVLVCAFIAIEPTGVYSSPYMLLIFVLIFVAEAVNTFGGAAIVLILILGYIFNFMGLFAGQADLKVGAIVIVIATASAVAGYFFWRRYYIRSEDTNTITRTLADSLQGEKAKSDIILQTIDDGVILIDSNSIIQLFNPAASKITGWPVNEAVGLDFRSVMNLVNEKGEAYADDERPALRAKKEKKVIRDNQAVLVTRSEKHVPVNISASPLLDQKQDVRGVVLVFRDVSEERGEEKRRADFISTASHEMRTPVAAIEGYLALALNERVSQIDTKARSYLEKAHSSTQHLGKLFQDLLTSAKAEDGRLSNHPTAIEMGDYLERLTEDLRFAAQKKGLSMEFTIGAHSQVIDASESTTGNMKTLRPLYYVHVDQERLREVITNLFDNAVKYTESGGVSIGLTGNDTIVQMYVRDTGPGIPPEDIPHLFQKFYRVDNSATRTIGGTGLGLFICRKIVELYNGRIWVESELGKGSNFFINLPRINNQKAEQLMAAEAAQATPLSQA